MEQLYSKSNIPIDVIISPEREVAKALYRKLEAPGALDNVPFVKDKVKLLEILIEKQMSNSKYTPKRFN